MESQPDWQKRRLGKMPGNHPQSRKSLPKIRGKEQKMARKPSRARRKAMGITITPYKRLFKIFSELVALSPAE